MKISVVIPTYEMFGKGAKFLERSLDVLARQTFRNFEVVISDNSENNEIKNIALKGWGFPVVYDKNKGSKNLSGNVNNGISKSSGEYIKILFQDDYLASEYSLEDLASFKGEWLVTGCSNHLNPYWSEGIKKGINTIGSPSVLMIKNHNPLLFNENLTWVVDLEYYIRLYERYGLPTSSNKVNVVIEEGEHQLTNKLSDGVKQDELKYLCEHY